jgi:putative tricarboxylic transport membrane protein
MLLVLNLPLIGLWVMILKVPYRIIFPIILLFCLIGSYAINLSLLDLKLMLGFGILGYVMRKFDFDAAPLCLAFVLGPLMEVNMRQALILSQGSFTIFFTRPISAVCLGVAALLLLTSLLPFIRRRWQRLEKIEIK